MRATYLDQTVRGSLAASPCGSQGRMQPAVNRFQCSPSTRSFFHPASTPASRSAGLPAKSVSISCPAEQREKLAPALRDNRIPPRQTLLRAFFHPARKKNPAPYQIPSDTEHPSIAWFPRFEQSVRTSLPCNLDRRRHQPPPACPLEEHSVPRSKRFRESRETSRSPNILPTTGIAALQ